MRRTILTAQNRKSVGRAAGRIGLVMALGGAMASCMGAPAGGLGPVPLTPTSRFTLQVETGLDRIALAVHDTGPSASQQAALVSLIGRARASGATRIMVQAPGGQDPVSNQFAWAIKETLDGLGAAGQVEVLAYDAPDPRAPVLVGFETLRAVVPQCGTHWDNLSRTANNATSSNFGCAVTANLAAQIADPRDIIQPRTITPTDASRRAVVFDNYRKGTATSAIQETLLAQGRVSQAVN